MSRDVIVYTKIDAKPRPSEALDILLLSTQGGKELKVYRDLDVIADDYGEDSKIHHKADKMFNQPNTLATTLIRKVKLAGIETPTSPADMIASIEELREINDDWYIILTDKDEDEYIKALAAWAKATEPTEAQLGAGVEDHRKFYFAQTDNKDLECSDARVVIVYTDHLNEEADAAYVGNVGPNYPYSVTWKFKTPDGLALPDLTEGEKDALEEKNFNFLAEEYKKQYIKNGTCANGEFIDVVLGADYITQYMREALYSVFLTNNKVPYTDEGFALVASAVFSALNRAVELGIIALDTESESGVYTVEVPKRADATDDEARSRRIPDIVWEAQLEGAVHSVKVTGTLKATL